MANRISQLLSARVIENRVISLTAASHLDVKIRLFGSTVQTSVMPVNDYDSFSHLNFYPEPGKDGLVALGVTVMNYDMKGKLSHREDHSGLFKITWKEKDGEEGQKYPFIDLAEPWVSADRIGQTTKEAITVTLKSGRGFTSNDPYKYSSDKKTDPRLPIFVPDGDLLCRYLFGTAHASDVLHAAVQRKLEPLAAQRVESLTRQVRRLDDIRRIAANELERSAGALLEVMHRLTLLEPLRRKIAGRPKFLRSKEAQAFIDAMDGNHSVEAVRS